MKGDQQNYGQIKSKYSWMDRSCRKTRFAVWRILFYATCNPFIYPFITFAEFTFLYFSKLKIIKFAKDVLDKLKYKVSKFNVSINCHTTASLDPLPPPRKNRFIVDVRSLRKYISVTYGRMPLDQMNWLLITYIGITFPTAQTACSVCRKIHLTKSFHKTF